MSGGTTTAIYLLLGLGLVAGLYYALTQITARQRRLNAELTRLERLAAEVAMNAEAILERVDERIERLEALAAEVEAKVNAARAAVEPQPLPAPEEAPVVPAAQPAAEEAPSKPKRQRSKTAGAAQPEPPAPASAEPKAQPNYQERRAAVFAMADEGKEIGEIAQALGIPRGEVQLMLNLRGRKVTA